MVGLPPEDDGGCSLDRGAIQKIAARTGEGEPFVEEMYRRAREMLDNSEV